MDRLEPPLEQELNELIDAAAAHHAAGRLVEAEACYRQIVARVPNWAEAINNLGCVLWDRGDGAAAQECYRKAIVLDPAHAKAHFNLGFALQQGGQLNQAMACYANAISLDPSHAKAHGGRGVILLRRGNLTAAEMEFQRAISIDPDDADAYNNLGNVLHAGGKFGAAGDCYHRAIAIHPKSPEYRNNLGLALEDQGRLDDSIDAYRQAILLNASFVEAHYNLSQLKTFRQRDADFVALEHCAGQSDSLPADKRPLVHFAMAKAYDDLAEYPHAFAQMTKGNQRKRQMVSYDDGEIHARVQQIIELFSADRMRQKPGRGDGSAVPIFVIGMPRSGSTLIEQILCSHPLVQGGGELTLLSRIITGGRDASGRQLKFSDFISSALGDDARVLQHLAKLYLKGIPPLRKGKSRLTDKMPANFLHAGWIHLMLPNARIIHTVRDPVDTCFSCYSKLFSSGVLYSYDLRELGRYYRAYRKLMDHWRSVLPAGVMLDISYEGLVENPEAVARRMIDHCELPWDLNCLEFHTNPRSVATASRHQVHRPMYRESVGRWKRYESQMQPLLEELRLS